MMPLAPHISLPAIGHMTATTATTTSDTLSTNMSSKPKLAFSIDSIVGRKSSSAIDCIPESNRHSPRLSTEHKSRYSPVNYERSLSPPLISNRINECSPQMVRQLSPSNRSATNISPMSTPSPTSMSNGSASSPYLEPSRVNPQLMSQIQNPNQPNIGPTGQLTHPLMMAAAHHMTPIPQPYHQAVALYPWLFRANPFANRFHGMPFDGGLSSFLLPPFRKPKRIRTAFSPGQLLKLEQAFEKNHYVVGAERKQLASGLGLSETQVKVWFQNRRTKHKRQKQEDDEQGDGHSDKHKNNSDKSGADTDVDDEEEDEDIDMDDNEESDSNTNELLFNSDLKHHQLWYQSMQSAHHSPPVSLPTTHTLSSASSSTPKI